MTYLSKEALAKRTLNKMKHALKSKNRKEVKSILINCNVDVEDLPKDLYTSFTKLYKKCEKLI